MTRIFNPDSWRRAGEAVEDASGDVLSRLKGPLGSVQVTGEGGLTLLDGLVAAIVPAVMEAVDDALGGMASGLKAEAGGLVDTGRAYATVEAEATEIGNFMEGEI